MSIRGKTGPDFDRHISGPDEMGANELMRFPRTLGAYGVTPCSASSVVGWSVLQDACAAPVTATNDVMKVADQCTPMVNQQRAARGIGAVGHRRRVQTAAQKHSTLPGEHQAR